MKNNSFLTSLSMGLIRDVQSLMAGNSSVEAPLEQLGEAAKVLTDKQKKIDKNHNGKLDAEDFAKLRKEGIDRVVITSPYTPDIHGGLAEVTHRDIRTGVVTVVFENMFYKLKKGQFNELPESFEQLDELSKATLGSYVKKAANSMAQSHAEVEKARADRNAAHAIDHATTGTPSDVRQKVKDIISNDASKREKTHFKDVIKRHTGIGKATDKLTKEEVEDLEELSKGTLAKYIPTAAKDLEQATHDQEYYGHDQDFRRGKNRLKGIGVAVKKLAKEEVEDLEELSTGTLSSYADKARPQSYTSGGKDIKKRFNRIDGGVLAHAKMKNDKVRVPANEEVEELDELSNTTLGSYTKKAAADFKDRKPKMGYDGQLKKMQNRKVGVNKALDKMYGEDVELTQDEIDNIEAALADLDEGRGRPPKEGSEAWKRRQMQAAEDVPALGIQLRKAASINKPVIFANGESKQIHPNHINRFNDHMDARKTSQEKAEFQKTANKSHADFVKAVTADVPHRSKDTGEIVKYGK